MNCPNENCVHVDIFVMRKRNMLFLMKVCLEYEQIKSDSSS